MINTLTLEEAIEIVPAIASTHAHPSCSNQYTFVSTKDVVTQAINSGWKINNATSCGKSQFAQHRVTLIHEDHMNSNTSEGFPRIEIFNSHNRTKRLTFAIGYFRVACSNGLIVASGPTETIKTRHRFGENNKQNIIDSILAACSKFPTVLNTIEQFKDRQLSEEEQQAFAEYAIKGRFLYRQTTPKRFAEYSTSVPILLNSRRREDNGNQLWETYNRVQENLIRGVEGFSKPITGYLDSLRVNQLLWKGAATALNSRNNNYRQNLASILSKN